MKKSENSEYQIINDDLKPLKEWKLKDLKVVLSPEGFFGIKRNFVCFNKTCKVWTDSFKLEDLPKVSYLVQKAYEETVLKNGGVRK